MRDSSGFADYLRRAMRAVGIDPDERGAAAALARKTGLSETQTSRWLKRGDQPSIQNLRKLSPALRVRMSDLLLAAGYVTAEELSGESATTAERGIIEDPTLGERERRLLLTLLSEMREDEGAGGPPPPSTPPPEAGGRDAHGGSSARQRRAAG